MSKTTLLLKSKGFKKIFRYFYMVFYFLIQRSKQNKQKVSEIRFVSENRYNRYFMIPVLSIDACEATWKNTDAHFLSRSTLMGV
jgi:hypothetical protein